MFLKKNTSPSPQKAVQMKKGSASTSDSKTQNPFAQSLEKRAPNPFAQAFQAIVKKTSPTSTQPAIASSSSFQSDGD